MILWKDHVLPRRNRQPIRRLDKESVRGKASTAYTKPEAEEVQ